jgi:hypothetical protein
MISRLGSILNPGMGLSSTTKGVKSFVDSQRQHRGVTNKPTHVGIGRVVSIGESEKVNIFFLQR